MLSSILTPTRPINIDQELLNSIRLIRTENVGVKTFHSLTKLYGTATNALDHVKELSLRGGKKTPIHIYPKENAEKEIDQHVKMGAEIISYLDSNYPLILKETSDFPPVISVLGQKSLLNRPTIAIVGARNASQNGRIFAAKLAEALGKEKINIASGLARGIDTAAHHASLPYGTIAVIAGGLGHIYPAENEKLYHMISEKGAIIAELPIMTAPKSQHFPQRNRIISGISYGVVVVEAAMESGSLITAKMAIDQNREVFAVPGFPLDPRAKGCNYLIKQGAFLIDSIENFLDNLPNFNINERYSDNQSHIYTPVSIAIDENELVNAREEIYMLLSSTPISMEEIAKETKISLPVIYTILLELELAGKIIRGIGNKFSAIYF
jgi:DNA processing protein